jgi:hypothetical protein
MRKDGVGLFSNIGPSSEMNLELKFLSNCMYMQRNHRIFKAKRIRTSGHCSESRQSNNSDLLILKQHSSNIHLPEIQQAASLLLTLSKSYYFVLTAKKLDY